MLAVPDQSSTVSKVADWLELKAVSSPDGRVGFGTLISGVAMSENEQENNIADEDAQDDRLVLEAQNEIARRLKNVGEYYPFRIDARGSAMEFVAPQTLAGSAYLFCLFLSHAFDRSIIPKTLAPRVTSKTRDLFQACATVAAGGFVTGPAMSFGFPRPDGSSFIKALHRVYKAFGDGTPRRKPRAAAARAIKDNGIDIVAWRRSIDNLPCTLYLIGQVASGADWENKSVIPDRKHFHLYWFTSVPASQPHDAMFMPFALEPDDPQDGTSYDDLLKDYMQSVGYRYGTLFYRDRIARYLADGDRCVSEGEIAIERHQDLPKMVRWVNSYATTLRAA